jgi:hypothetical protein
MGWAGCVSQRCKSGFQSSWGAAHGCDHRGLERWGQVGNWVKGLFAVSGSLHSRLEPSGFDWP